LTKGIDQYRREQLKHRRQQPSLDAAVFRWQERISRALPACGQSKSSCFVGYLHVDGRYAFDGEALTEVEACAFDRRRFDVFAAQHPDLAAAVGETLSAALRQSGEAMLVLGQLRSTERVANFLAEMDTLYRQRQISSRPLTLKMNRTEIADYLGLTVETVSRAFGKLKARSVVGLMGSDEVIVLDSDRLRHIGKVGRDAGRAVAATDR